ncbi:DUF6338 family protein [Mycolicibacter sinensis]|uniref:Transmembrane protein n=1 Tax=Mycolicibacter sinensis (strain JDM601) TaxID=875328 RepID=A0A1A2NTR9_MYCSD|nr:DUF6338 family protein [Mycolicibacter sinensis]OBH18485.1 hypothetical protein A5694_21575 [Mycolicibacter sinensis]OBI25927.1 hypothetical protein A5710_07905 [Mycolicibacter sinensis]
MPSTFQALAVALLALLPGALYELAREQRSGRWGLRGADQVFGLLAFSVVFQVAIAPLTYWLYARYVVTGHFRVGRPVSGWLWALLCAYLVVPFVFGRFTALGHRYRSGQLASTWERAVVRLVNLYTDAAPAPRAWDYLFSDRSRKGWIILHLKDGSRVGGAWNGSYAAGYPDDQDLYLSRQVALTADGRFRLGDDGQPHRRESGLLIRWNEVQYLDFYDT